MPQIRGVNVPLYPASRSGHITTLDDVKRLYDDAQKAEVTGVMWNPIQYAFLPTGSATIAKPPPEFLDRRLLWRDWGNASHEWPETVSPDLLYLALLEGKTRGLYVGLKPMVDLQNQYGPAGSRVYMSVAGQEKPFLRSYKYDFLKSYVEMAKDAHTDLFVIGTELYTVTKELSYRWVNEMTNYVQYTLKYRGQLTYAANWGNGLDAEFRRLNNAWPYLRYVGVDAYWPLVGEDVPVDDEYEQKVYEGWSEQWELLMALSNAGSRLHVTEVGYRADDRAAVDPWADPIGVYGEAGATPLNKQAQVDCWRAFRRLTPYPAAYWAWSYQMYPDLIDPRAHNLRGSGEAERVALAEVWE